MAAAIRQDLGSYGISALVGVVTYLAYAILNDAWGNPVLVAVALYMFLSIPGYSRLSNRIETWVTGRYGLETGGRLCRYLGQLAVNLVLLWVFIRGGIVHSAGLDGLGGFFGAAAWITVVSQGGQYLATWLAARGIGGADLNVVLAIAVSAFSNALAISGVLWVQPIYLSVSLTAGLVILLSGVLADLRASVARSAGRALS